jgi:hypothetical protein
VETRKTIGRYEIRDCVGRGGMGALFRGHDPVLDREVAIKTMLADLSRDEDGRARFYREARAVARLQHRNIVTLFDFGEDEGTLYIVMEFLTGVTVAEAVKSGASLAIDRILDIGAQLCTGLHFAHLRGVVHRDIKPPNIWLNDDGGVKLLDFGIAKFGDTTVTRIGGVVGSVSYMSPEQVSGEEDVDGRSDIFSVGIVLYELLCGHRPFRAESPTGIMMKIVNEPTPPLEVPGLPSQVVAVIERALEKDRAKRYQQANEMATELRNLQIQVSGRAGTSPRLSTTAPIAHRIDGEFETHAGQESPFAQAVHASHATPAPAVEQADPDIMNRWSLGTAEDLVADAVITPPDALAALRRKEAKQQASAAASSRPPEWLTRWPTLAAAGGAVAIAAFAAVLMMRAESSGVDKHPAGTANTGKAAATTTGAGSTSGKTAGGTTTPANAGTKGAAGAGTTGATGPTGTKTGDPTASDSSTGTTAPAAETDVHVLLSGPYAFTVVDDNGRAISGLYSKHDLRVPPKQVLILQAPQVFLKQRITIDGKPGSTVRQQAPGVGELAVRTEHETCKVLLDGYDLGYPPIAKVNVAAGTHRVTLKCPDGDSQNETVTISPGAKEVKLLH